MIGGEGSLGPIKDLLPSYCEVALPLLLKFFSSLFDLSLHVEVGLNDSSVTADLMLCFRRALGAFILAIDDLSQTLFLL